MAARVKCVDGQRRVERVGCQNHGDIGLRLGQQGAMIGKKGAVQLIGPSLAQGWIDICGTDDGAVGQCLQGRQMGTENSSTGTNNGVA